MWAEVKKFIQSHDAFLITAHINPDGDAIGSEVALKLFLESIGKRVAIVNSSETPDNIAFLDDGGDIAVFPSDVGEDIFEEYRGVFILDVNNWEHLGAIGPALRGSTLARACIDHHEGIDEDFAEAIVSDTSAASTGILIYELIRYMGGAVTGAIAEAIYATIITDTGTFRFSNTDARAFRVAADLCELGANPFKMHRRVFASKTWAAGKMLGPVLSTIESTADGRLVWITATQAMIATAGATYDDTDGFVDLVRAIKGVELVLFFKEVGEGNVKVSLRSNGTVDAHAVAASFGGGGHRMASGMRVSGPLSAAIERVVATCREVDGIRR